MKNQLTLLISYRRRKLAFESFYNWLLWQKNCHHISFPLQIILIENDLACTSTIKEKIENLNFKYYFVPGEGIFHKTYLLNIGLSYVKTKFVMAYDIDLIPYQDCLSKHLNLTINNHSFLVTGYRLMLNESYLEDFNQLESYAQQGEISNEDQPTALKKNLISFEKMGVLPIFETEKLLKIGGWDENFLGWGGEDQDLIQRYCLTYNYTMCKVPELVYLHLKHDYESTWYSSTIIAQNRSYFYQKNYHNLM
jgi:predicted glycosyltransferase involved in capsule biosynthesis